MAPLAPQRYRMRSAAVGVMVIFLLLAAPPAQAAVTLRQGSFQFDSLTNARLWHNTTFTDSNASQIRTLADEDGDGMITSREQSWAEAAVAVKLDDSTDRTQLQGATPSYGRVKKASLTNLTGPVDSTKPIDLDLLANMTFPNPAASSEYRFTWQTRTADKGPWNFVVPKGYKIERFAGLSNPSPSQPGARIQGESDGAADMEVWFKSTSSPTTSPSATPDESGQTTTPTTEAVAGNVPLDDSQTTFGDEVEEQGQPVSPAAVAPTGKWALPLLGGGALVGVGVFLGLTLASRLRPSPPPADRTRTPATAAPATALPRTRRPDPPASTTAVSSPPVQPPLPPLPKGAFVGPPDHRLYRVHCPQCRNAVVGRLNALPECARCGFNAWEAR